MNIREALIKTKVYYLESVKLLLSRAIEKANEELKLNVPLEIDIKYGRNYAECH